MKVNGVSETLESLKILEDLVNTTKKFYLEFYLLDNQESGRKLRKQLKAIELQCKIICDESLTTNSQRRTNGFTLSKIAKGTARKILESELQS